VSVIAAGDGLFPRLAKLIGRPDLPADPRFHSLEARVQNSDEVNGIVAAWCKRHDAAEIERRCLDAGVPFAQVRAVSNIVERRNRAAWRLDDAIASLAEAVERILRP